MVLGQMVMFYEQLDELALENSGTQRVWDIYKVVQCPLRCTGVISTWATVISFLLTLNLCQEVM